MLYDRVMPGSQLVNRLQDLNYRVQTLSDPGKLVESAVQYKPLLVLADVGPARRDVCTAIGHLKENPATSHVPVIAFGGDNSADCQAAALAAGATLVIGEAAALNHLREFLDQALQVE